MKTARKEPRINLRFKSFNLMDRFEQYANRRGLTLADWILTVITNEVESGERNRAQKEQELKFLISTYTLLCQQFDEKAVTKADRYALDCLIKFKKMYG